MGSNLSDDRSRICDPHSHSDLSLDRALGPSLEAEIQAIRKLLAEPRTIEFFESLIEAEHHLSGTGRELFKALGKPTEESINGLQALVSLGGLPGKLGLRILSTLSEEGDRRAKQALTTSITNRGIYAGSFDPITIGHRDLIERAALKCDHLIVAIGTNPGKRPVFSVDERIALIKEEIKGVRGALISVESFSGSLNNFAREWNAKTLFRGVRAITDLDQESQQAQVNRNLSESDLDTIFLPSRLELTNISSTNARILAELGEDLSGHVSVQVASALIRKKVEQQWQALTRHLNLDPTESTLAFADLLGRYAEPGRKYHNLRHIYETLVRADEASEAVKDLGAVKLALFFHDAVYDTSRSDNEERSAELAERVLTALAVRDETISKVKEFTLATKKHMLTSSDPDLKVFLDCDLSILAAKPTRYSEYATAIRAEYGQYEDSAYKLGRGQILSGFLKRERLFFSDYFFERLESLARKNLQGEVNKPCANDF